MGKTIVNNNIKLKSGGGIVNDAADGLSVNNDEIIFQEIFGDGSDGNVVISTDTSLTRDMFYNNLTINAGISLHTAGFRVFVREKLINNGTIHNNGGNGSASSSGTAVGGSAGSTGSLLGGGAGGGPAQTYCGSGGGGGGVLMLFVNEVFVEGNIQANGGNGGNAIDSGGSVTVEGASGGNVANALINANGGSSLDAYGSSAGVVTNVRTISEIPLILLPFIDTINMVALGGGAGGMAGGRIGTNEYGGGGGGGGTIVYCYRQIITPGTISANGGIGGNHSPNGKANDGNNGKVIKKQII